jgi:hypothetical protein
MPNVTPVRDLLNNGLEFVRSGTETFFTDDVTVQRRIAEQKHNNSVDAVTR